MLIVKRRKHESVDQLIKRFRNRVKSEGILLEAIEKQHFIKPGLRKEAKKRRKLLMGV